MEKDFNDNNESTHRQRDGVSQSKTTVYFLKNVPFDLRSQISGAFRFQEVWDIGKYLGVPLLHNHRRTCLLLAEEHLLKQFSQPFPSIRCKLRLSPRRHVWCWSGLFDFVGRMCASRIIMVDLVSKKLNVQNETFLMKLAFQLVANKDALWVRFLRAKYKCDMVVSSSILTHNCSRIWKGLSLVWEDVVDNIPHRICNERSIDFW
ncbi:hypothetical protein GQ457_10G006720 [Hibiscus cannabinus]